jgi:hypothetical protein
VKTTKLPQKCFFNLKFTEVYKNFIYDARIPDDTLLISVQFSLFIHFKIINKVNNLVSRTKVMF